mmetsp:Transcript_29376/g.78927  ORF Transcript_29376/g.78927 Transcript_29376/m.78927 type:complete len:241 (+) Transcript_29376:370-1092(+)
MVPRISLAPSPRPMEVPRPYLVEPLAFMALSMDWISTRSTVDCTRSLFPRTQQLRPLSRSSHASRTSPTSHAASLHTPSGNLAVASTTSATLSATAITTSQPASKSLASPSMLPTPTAATDSRPSVAATSRSSAALSLPTLSTSTMTPRQPQRLASATWSASDTSPDMSTGQGPGNWPLAVACSATKARRSSTEHAPSPTSTARATAPPARNCADMYSTSSNSRALYSPLAKEMASHSRL